ncbi:MAG: hypothetical protein HOK75_01190 [Phycisphaerae bacterium]|jgi:hypothetical protein|nr:hypothetical protein [Phycisphaerae bacterium]MBT5408858.1 hypothetical protein [Phycisphaerae bacterium]MBT6164292.1 hypothetical protein [Phycisphaerae bacterium]MBT7657357.1 hypothetical protein [Phycisphaerae bacterium]
MALTEQVHLATLWFLSARAMAVAGADMPTVQEAATGLYAQAILGFSEEDCRKAKSADHISNKTLIDCLSGVQQLPKEVAEKILTGVMMISYADRKMKPLEVRWASMLASAIDVTPDDFQRCCVNARVIASMLRPHGAPA